MLVRAHVLRFVAPVLMLLASGHADALYRAYLSSTGDDSNPCTLSAPCRLLPAALAAADAGGEVWMLDSANYNVGPVVVTKSVTILAVEGARGSVVGNNGDAFTIATAGIDVVLRNLQILHLANGNDGIKVTVPLHLTIEGCEVANFPGIGILAGTAGGFAPEIRITLRDVLVRNNGTGVSFHQARADVVRTSLIRNAGAGVQVNSGSLVHIVDSLIAHNGNGVSATSMGSVFVIRSTSAYNASDGFGTLAFLPAEYTLSQSVAIGNQRYGLVNGAGVFNTQGDNLAIDNALGDTSGSFNLDTTRY
jgi:hypothetical protein